MTVHEITTLTANDPDAKHLHSLLDLLGEEDYTDRNKWRDVVFAHPPSSCVW